MHVVGDNGDTIFSIADNKINFMILLRTACTLYCTCTAHSITHVLVQTRTVKWVNLFSPSTRTFFRAMECKSHRIFTPFSGERMLMVAVFFSRNAQLTVSGAGREPVRPIWSIVCCELAVKRHFSSQPNPLLAFAGGVDRMIDGRSIQ